MMPRFAFPSDAVRKAENSALETSPETVNGTSTVMETAAYALATAIIARLKGQAASHQNVGPKGIAGRKVIMLIGPGNNGGDALFAGVRLVRRGVHVTAVQCSASVHRAGMQAFLKAGGTVCHLLEHDPQTPDRVISTVQSSPSDNEQPPSVTPFDKRSGNHVNEIVERAANADIVVDALLGIGARGGLRGAMAEVVEGISAILDASQALGTKSPEVVAVDLPSGIGVDDGSVPGPVLRATESVTFGVAKPGLWLPPAANFVGDVTVADLGIVTQLSADGAVPTVEKFGPKDVAAWWPRPRIDDNKYSRGVLGVVAGSKRYPGAAVLAVGGAMASGVGLARYVGPELAQNLVHRTYPEVVAGAKKAVAWTVGSGVCLEDSEQSDCVRDAIGKARRGPLPIVIDAGGLELLPSQLTARILLTPHAGELARLLSHRGVECTSEEIALQPYAQVRKAAELYGATILLKGPTTLIATPAGRVIAIREATSWLATAGAGDVLSGIIGALFAGSSDLVRESADVVADLAAVGVVVHGQAARRAAQDGPIRAMDVIAALPTTIRELLSGQH